MKICKVHRAKTLEQYEYNQSSRNKSYPVFFPTNKNSCSINWCCNVSLFNA